MCYFPHVDSHELVCVKPAQCFSLHKLPRPPWEITANNISSFILWESDLPNRGSKPVQPPQNPSGSRSSKLLPDQRASMQISTCCDNLWPGWRPPDPPAPCCSASHMWRLQTTGRDVTSSGQSTSFYFIVIIHTNIVVLGGNTRTVLISSITQRVVTEFQWPNKCLSD